MAWQRWYNRPIVWLLRSPFHRALSGSVLLLTYRGRRTGLPHTTPLNYARDGDSILLLSPRAHTWWRNLRDERSVEILVRGRRYRGTGRVLDVEETLSKAVPRPPAARGARCRRGLCRRTDRGNAPVGRGGGVR